MSKLKKTFNDINNRFCSLIEEVVKTSPELDIKKNMIEDISEEYYAATGEMLPSYMISQLTDWLLSDDLKSRNVDKVSNNPYPILSSHQIKRRHKKHPIIDSEVIDYVSYNKSKNKKTYKRREM